jgi:hypothetical protein
MTTETGFTPIAVQKNTPKYNGLSIIVASAFQVLAIRFLSLIRDREKSFE